jgi:hypothetical protein
VNNVCSTLEKRIYDETAALDEKFTGTCDLLEKKAATKNAEQDDIVDRQEQHFTAVSEALEGKLKEKTSWLDEKFSDVCSLLDRKFTEETAKNIDRIESEHKLTSDTCAAITKEFHETSNELDDRFGGFCNKLEASGATTDARLTQGMRELDTKLSNRTTDLNNKIEGAVAEIGNELHSIFTELGAKLEGSVGKLDKKIGGVESSLEIKMDNSIGSLQTSVESAVDELDRKLEESDAVLSKAITENQKAAAKELADIDDANAERMKAEHKHFTEECTNLDRKLNEKANDLDMKFTNNCIRMEKQFAADLDEHDERINTEQKYNREAMKELEQRFTDEINVLEKSTDDKNAKQDHNVAELSKTVDQHHDYFESVTQQLDKKFSEDGHARDVVIKEHHKELTNELTKLDQKYSDENDHLETVLRTSTAGLDSRLVDLEEKVTEHHETFSAALTAMDRKFDERCGEQDDSISDARKESAQQCDGLEKQFTASSLSLSERLETMGKHFTATSSKLDKKITESTTELNKRLIDSRNHFDAELADKISAQEKKSEWLQKYFTDMVAKQERRILDEVKEVADAGAEASDRFEKASTALANEMAEKIETEHRHFTSLCATIEKFSTDVATELRGALADTTTEHKAKLEDMAMLIDENNGKHTDALATLAKRFSDENSTLEKLIDDCWKRLEAKSDKVAELAKRQFLDLDTKLEAKESALATAIRKLSGQVDEDKEAFTQLLAEMTKRSNDKAAEQDDAIENMEMTFGDALSRLEQKTFEENSARDAGVNTELKSLSHAIESSRAKSAEDTSELFKNFSKDTARLEKTMLNKIGEFERKQEALVVMVQEEVGRVEDLAGKVDEQLQLEFADAYDKLAERITKEVGEQGAEIDQEHAYFRELFRKLDKKYGDDKDVLDAKIDARFRAADESILARASEADSKIDMLQKLTADSIDAVEKRLASPLVKLEERVSNDFTKIERDIKRITIEQSEKLESGLSAMKVDHIGLSKKCLDDLRDLDDKLSEGLAKNERKFSEKQAEAAAQAEADIKRCMEESAKINIKFSKKTGDQEEKFTTMCSNLQKAAATRNADFEKRIEAMKKKVDEDFAALGQRTKQATTALDEKYNEKVDALQRQVSGNKTVIETRVDSVHKNLSEKFDSLDRRSTEQHEEAEQRFTLTSQTLEHSIAKNMEDMSDHVAGELKNLDYTCKRLEKTLTDELDEIRAEGAQADIQHDAKLAEINLQIDAHHKFFSAANERLEKSISSSSAHLDTVIDSHFRQLSEEFETLQSKTASEYQFLEAKFSDQEGFFNERIDKLCAEVIHWDQATKDRKVEVDGRMDALDGKVDDAIKEHYDYFFDKVIQLNTVFRDGMKGMKKAAADNKDKIEAVDRDMRAAVEESEKEIKALVANTKKDLTGFLEAQMVHVSKEHETQSRMTIDEACNTLDARLSTKSDDSLKEIRERHDIMERELKESLKKLDDSADERFKRAHDYSVACNEKIDEVTEDFNSSLEKKLGVLQKQLEAAKAEARASLADASKTLKDQISDTEKRSEEFQVETATVLDEHKKESLDKIELLTDHQASMQKEYKQSLDSCLATMKDNKDLAESRDIDTKETMRRFQESMKDKVEAARVYADTKGQAAEVHIADVQAKIQAKLTALELDTRAQITKSENRLKATQDSYRQEFDGRLDRDRKNTDSKVIDITNVLGKRADDFEKHQSEYFNQLKAKVLKDLGKQTTDIEIIEQRVQNNQQSFEEGLKTIKKEEETERLALASLSESARGAPPCPRPARTSTLPSTRATITTTTTGCR